MHPYSIDKKSRTKITILLFLCSIFIASLLELAFGKYIESLKTWLNNTPLASEVNLLQSSGVVPDVLGTAFIYWLLEKLFEKCLWKCSLIRKIHGIPDLNGKWKGNLTSSYGTSIPMELDVTQTWSEISFKATFSDSNSYSNTAAIYVDDNQGISIYFGFCNNSRDIGAGMQIYDGYNILTLENDNKISARYFNNRPNANPQIKGGNKGRFDLKRVQ